MPFRLLRQHCLWCLMRALSVIAVVGGVLLVTLTLAPGGLITNLLIRIARVSYNESNDALGGFLLVSACLLVVSFANSKYDMTHIIEY